MAVPDIAIIGGGPSGLTLAGILERAGFTSYVVYERTAADAPPRGGCLDLHEKSGQLAVKEAGCYEVFKKYARGGDASIYRLWTHEGNKVLEYQEDNSPELDRHQIKRMLLTTIPEDKIQWEKTLTEAERNDNGNVVLKFEDGTTATGFKLVVGADGVYSKIRHLVTDAKPRYSDVTFWTGEIHASNSFYSTIEKTAQYGPMMVMGRSTMIWIQRQGDGHYRIDVGFQKPEDFTKNSPVELSDTEAVKKLMLSDDNYGHHAELIKNIINAIDSPFHAWPLYYMPPESLNWKPNQDVTLIGDAAHVTTPFAGEGVNTAMEDCIILTQKLKEFGISQKAIREYEADMFSRADDVIRRSVQNGEVYFKWDAPHEMLEGMKKKQAEA